VVVAESIEDQARALEVDAEVLWLMMPPFEIKYNTCLTRVNSHSKKRGGAVSTSTLGARTGCADAEFVSTDS
jgi:hypothetical protein